MRPRRLGPGRLGPVWRWSLPRSCQLLRVFSGDLTTIRAQTHLLAPATLSSGATHGSPSSPSPWAPALIPTKSGLFAETPRMYPGSERQCQGKHNLCSCSTEGQPGVPLGHRRGLCSGSRGPARGKGKAQPLPGGKMRPIGGK